MSKKYLNKELLGQVFTRFQSAVEFVGAEEAPALLTNSDTLLDLLRYLKEEPKLDLAMLSNETAVDYPEYYEMVYHLYSMHKGHTVTVKVRVEKENPVVPSITGIWQSADFQEREVYDLMGIVFTGHENLKRILLPDDFDGHPLQKNFKAVKQEARV